MSLTYGWLEVVENPHTDGRYKNAKVEFTFNPAKLQLNAAAKWDQPTAGGAKKSTEPQYKGPDAQTLEIELLFDTWEENGPGHKKKSPSVFVNVQTLISWTRPTEKSRGLKKPKSPLVALVWGKKWFTCYVASVNASFTMFAENGTPLRATVKVSLKELPGHGEGDPQNPTSGSRAGHQSHLVVEGDSLALIAYRYYEKATYWRGLAVANDIDNPLRIRPGTRLSLPPIEDVAALSA